MTSFDTDDLYTYNAHYETVEWIGCGGEFCPGPYDDSNPRLPGDPDECGQCRYAVPHTARQLVPNGM
jgi:hypothetical protein